MQRVVGIIVLRVVLAVIATPAIAHAVPGGGVDAAWVWLQHTEQQQDERQSWVLEGPRAESGLPTQRFELPSVLSAGSMTSRRCPTPQSARLASDSCEPGVSIYVERGCSNFDTLARCRWGMPG